MGFRTRQLLPLSMSLFDVLIPLSAFFPQVRFFPTDSSLNLNRLFITYLIIFLYNTPDTNC
jgi:hypothetical protein